jgi:hypothetical protein
VNPTVVARQELSGAQVKTLREFIAGRFTLADLRMLTREEFDLHLRTLVDENKSVNEIAFELIDRFNAEGRIAELVEAVAERRPLLRESLGAILAARVPEGPPPPEGDELNDFREALGRRRKWIRHLTAYKELHDILQNVGDVNPQIRDEAKARDEGGAAIPESTAATLRQWARECRRWVGETEFPLAPPLSVWVTRFEAAVADFLGGDAARRHRALERISGLPGEQLAHLNGELVACAGRVEAAELVLLLDRVPIATQSLTASVVRFREPCVSLDHLIADHRLCQQVDGELRKAAAVWGVRPATTDDLEWADALSWLGQLAAQRPGDYRVTRTRRAADAFAARPSAETFRGLTETFNDLFKKTDERLLRVTSQLVLAANDLTEALRESP